MNRPTRAPIPTHSTLADVVLDANVLVALLYDADVHRARARALASKLEAGGRALVLLDIVVYESVSVLCRRARERKTTPPDLERALGEVRGWIDGGHVRFVSDEATRLVRDVLDIVRETSGRLNFNDALLVALHRDGAYDALATFDPGFDGVPGLALFA